MKSAFRWASAALLSILLAIVPVSVMAADAAFAPASTQTIAATVPVTPGVTAAPLPINITVQAAPAAPAVAPTAPGILASIDWFSAAVWILSLGFAWLVKYLHDQRSDDTDTWWGLIKSLYNDAENLGLLKNWSGNDKLIYVMSKFDTAYQNAFGTAASNTERTAAQLALGQLAYHDNTNAPALTDVVAPATKTATVATTVNLPPISQPAR